MRLSGPTLPLVDNGTPVVRPPGDRRRTTVPPSSAPFALTVTRSCAALLFVIAGTVLAGRWLRVPVLVTLGTESAMAVNTALTLAVVAAALLAPRRHALALGIVVASVGVLHAVQNVAGFDLGLDHVIAGGGPVTGPPLFSTPMALGTAIMLFVEGAAIVSINTRWRRGLTVGQTLASTALAVSIVGTLAYAYDPDRLRTTRLLGGVAEHTTWALVIAAVGLLATHPDAGLMRIFGAPGGGGVMARRLLPVAVLFPPILGRLELLGEQLGYVAPSLGGALTASVTIVVLSALVWMTGRSVEAAGADLQRIEWLLTGHAPRPESLDRPYGDLVALNDRGEILTSVGHETLADIATDYMDLLDTSAAVYERDGQYALGIFTSGWCRYMDAASRRLCATDDNREALACGRWRCHESCWNDASKQSIAINGPVDIECAGGIRLYAMPIRAGSEVIGSINFGYGDPPRDSRRLRELAVAYDVPVSELASLAAKYESRPSFVIDVAKRRLTASARLIGEIVQRRRAQRAADALNADLEHRVAVRTAALEAAVQELEAFSYSVSHDLRAPLRALQGFSRILLEEHQHGLPPDVQRYLGRIRHNAAAMGDLIDDLLRFSRLGRQALRKEHIDMPSLVRQAWDQLEAERAGRRIELRLADLPACIADAALLRQVLVNLLSNAVKFTRRRDPALVEVGGACGDGGSLVYFVRDNGVGFEVQYAATLFGIFHRLHPADEYDGTGVGLAIVQRVVHRHGGRVWADSAPGRGATFFFSLPHSET